MDVRGIIDAVVRVVEPLARTKGLSVASRCAADLPARVRGDQQMVEEALLELARGAVNGTESGFVAISARHTTAHDGAVQVELLVRDTGSGVRETATCQRLVDILRGRLELEELSGEGMTARFVFPAMAAEEGSPDPAAWGERLPDGA